MRRGHDPASHSYQLHYITARSAALAVNMSPAINLAAPLLWLLTPPACCSYILARRLRPARYSLICVGQAGERQQIDQRWRARQGLARNGLAYV
jgi:hypothetical protein